MQNKSDLKDLTKRFALGMVRLVEALLKTQTAGTVGNQLLRSETSVAANYRAACRAGSTAEFIAKMGILEEKADESLFWMELLVESGIMSREKLMDLMKEANELIAITVASIKTARGSKR